MGDESGWILAAITKTCRPSGLNATEAVKSGGPWKSRSFCPLVASQRMAILSPVPVRICRPSELKAREQSTVVLINPVLDKQVRRLPEVPKIAGDEYGPVCQCDAGNEQIRVADLSDGLHRTKPLELKDCSIVE